MQSEIEAPRVRAIFELYREVKSLQVLADRLAEKGWFARKGKPWSRASLGFLLRNPVYSVARPSAVPDSTKPVVSVKLFREVQMLLSENRKR